MAAGASGGRFSGSVWIAVLFWGLSFVALRIVVDAFQPFAVVAIRLGIGAAFLFAMQVARGKPLLPERADRARCVGLGLVLGLHLAMQTFAMQSTSASRAGWIIAFVPVAIAIAARLFRGERVFALGWLGIAIASVGVVLLSSSKSLEPGEASLSHHALGRIWVALPRAFDALSHIGLGESLLLVSSATWAAYTLLSIAPVGRSGSLRVTASAMAVAALADAAAALGTGWIQGRVTPAAIGALLFLGLGCSGIAFWAWNAALKDIGPTLAGATLYLQPFVTLAASVAFLGEGLSASALASGALVLLGVGLLARAKAHGHTAPAAPDGSS